MVGGEAPSGCTWRNGGVHRAQWWNAQGTGVVRSSRPKITELGRLPNTRVYRDVSVFRHAVRFAGVKIVRFDAELNFTNKDLFESRLWAIVGEGKGKGDTDDTDAGAKPGRLVNGGGGRSGSTWWHWGVAYDEGDEGSRGWGWGCWGLCGGARGHVAGGGRGCCCVEEGLPRPNSSLFLPSAKY